MSIADLHIHHLRNIHHCKLHFHPCFNIIYGPNGSGKTSLLEAFYLLSTGHSFRSREISPLVSEGESNLTLFAALSQGETISIQKSLTGPTLVKVQGEFCTANSQLAALLPCQVFYQDIFQIINAGPSLRRNIIDWGLFHVEPTYLSLWKQYKQVLKQRNALLKQQASAPLFKPWDEQLVHYAEKLHDIRHRYFEKWSTLFYSTLRELTTLECSIHYYKGWDRKNCNENFKTILEQQFSRDKQYQFTHSGPHQADLIIETEQRKAKQLLSRGQQKLVLIALKLSQAFLLKKPCLFLFDDIASELDSSNLLNLMNYIKTLSGQFIITTTHNDFKNQYFQGECAEFSVDRGQFIKK